MSQRCETEVAKSLSKVQMPQPDIEFRQWFLNPLLGRTFGIVRYRSTWMEQMNNGGRGGSIFVDFSYTKGISDILSKTCHEVRQGTWMLQPAGERWKQNTLRQKGAKSTSNGFSSCDTKRHQGRKKETGSFIVASPVLLMFLTESSRILSLVMSFFKTTGRRTWVGSPGPTLKQSQVWWGTLVI